MAGPQDFMAPVPSLRVDTAPMLAVGGMLSQLPQNVAKSYEAGKDIAARNAFSEGIPLDKEGKPDMQAILSKTFQAGGVPAVQALMPYIIYMGGLSSSPSYNDLNPGASSPPPQANAPPLNPAGAGVRHIDPGRAADQSGAEAGQLPPGGGTREDPYRVSNRSDYDKVVDGAWYVVPGQVPRIKGQGGKAPTNVGPESADQATAPENAARGASPDERAASGGVSGSSAPTGKEMAAARGNLATRMDAAFGPGSTQAKTAGTPGPIAAPGAARPEPQISQAPAPAPAAPSSESRIPPIPKATEIQRPSIPPHDATAGDEKIAGWKADQRRLAVDIAKWGETNGPLKRNQGAIEAATQEINNLQKDIEKRQETLSEPFKKLNEARAQGFPSVQAKEASEKALEKANEAGQKQIEAINGYATAVAADLGPHISTGLDLLNSGKLYTGFGAHTMMDFNRAKQLYGNNYAATPQEAYEKTIAAIRLGQSNALRFMAQIGGGQQGAARIFAQQINDIGKASSDLGNTIAGNRFLLETARRSTEQIYDLQLMASKYIEAGHPFLDQKFDQMVVNYLRKNSLYKTDLEKSDPSRFLSAPQVPKAIATQAKDNPGVLEKWQHDVGAQKGDPIRRADGKGYFKALTVIEVPVPMSRK